MSDCDGVTKEQPAGLPVLPWEVVQRIDGLESKSVTHAQLRAAMVLVESLVTRVDALEARVTALEKRMDGFCELNLTLLGRVTVLEARPSVKSRAEYMRKYRAKGKPMIEIVDHGHEKLNPEFSRMVRDSNPYTIPTVPVSDTPPA